jgi:hypothetical protein
VYCEAWRKPNGFLADSAAKMTVMTRLVSVASAAGEVTMVLQDPRGRQGRGVEAAPGSQDRRARPVRQDSQAPRAPQERRESEQRDLRGQSDPPVQQVPQVSDLQALPARSEQQDLRVR